MDITMKVWDTLSYSWIEYVRRVPALFGHWLARQCKIITIFFNYEFKVCNICTILLENQGDREIVWEQFLHFFTYREKWLINYKIDKHLCYMDITMKVWDTLSYSWIEYVRRVPALFGHWLARQCKIITIPFNYEFEVCNVCTVLLENQVNREILFLRFFTYREKWLTKWTSTCVTIWKYGIRCPTGELNM